MLEGNYDFRARLSLLIRIRPMMAQIIAGTRRSAMEAAAGLACGKSLGTPRARAKRTSAARRRVTPFIGHLRMEQEKCRASQKLRWHSLER
jgi:hypothetical protein